MTWEELYQKLDGMDPDDRKKKAWILIEVGETKPETTVQEIDEFDTSEEYPMLELGDSYIVGFS